MILVSIICYTVGTAMYPYPNCGADMLPEPPEEE